MQITYLSKNDYTRYLLLNYLKFFHKFKKGDIIEDNTLRKQTCELNVASGYNICLFTLTECLHTVVLKLSGCTFSFRFLRYLPDPFKILLINFFFIMLIKDIPLDQYALTSEKHKIIGHYVFSFN